MTETPTAAAMSKDDYVKLAKFRHAIRRFADFSKTNAEMQGLTNQQHQALLSIRSFPDRDTVTVGELAQHLCIRQNSAVELVDRMEALGLVRRQIDAGDRRCVMVALTPASEAALHPCRALICANSIALRRRSPL